MTIRFSFPKLLG